MGRFDSLYRKEGAAKAHIDKILCILEGRDELIFVKRICEIILDKNISCENLLKKIKLSWGKYYTDSDGHRVRWIDKGKCNFQGGNIRGCKTPKPALEALNEALEDATYEGLVIMFDKDCDENEETEKEILNILKDKLNGNSGYIFYASDPCLEKEVLIIVKDDETENYIDSHYRIINNSRCEWFKREFRNTPKKIDYKDYQSCKRVIENLKKEELENSEMGKMFIEFFAKHCFRL